MIEGLICASCGETTASDIYTDEYGNPICKLCLDDFEYMEELNESIRNFERIQVGA